MTDVPIKDYPFQFTCPHCNEPAFFLKKAFQAGMLVPNTDVIFPDGTPIKAGDFVTCGSCHRRMVPKHPINRVTARS
jgi:hypothetical protein